MPRFLFKDMNMVTDPVMEVLNNYQNEFHSMRDNVLTSRQIELLNKVAKKAMYIGGAPRPLSMVAATLSASEWEEWQAIESHFASLLSHIQAQKGGA